MKELVEVKVKIYKHQLEYLKMAAKRIGVATAKRTKSGAWVSSPRVLRKILDEYIFMVRPNIKEIIKSKRPKKPTPVEEGK